MLTHLKKHVWYILASILLFISLVWITISLFSAKSDYETSLTAKENELALQDSTHRFVLDSLQKTRVEQISTIFSWSVRSELTRENLEQIDQLFRKFIKESGVKRVELIDETSHKVVMSSDRKTENEEIPSDNPMWNLSDMQITDNGDELLVLVPLMDLNKKVGVLRIIYAKNNIVVAE